MMSQDRVCMSFVKTSISLFSLSDQEHEQVLMATISTDSVNRGGKFCTLTLRLACTGGGGFLVYCPWSALKEILFLYFIHVIQSGCK